MAERKKWFAKNTPLSRQMRENAAQFHAFIGSVFAVLIADLVLVLHAMIVVFNTGGLAMILVGGPLGWQCVRHRGFRIAHISLMALVTVETIFGMTCPLTLLEDWLRDVATEQSFVQRWVTALIYWNAPLWVFAVLYSVILASVIVAWFVWPPRVSVKESARR